MRFFKSRAKSYGKAREIYILLYLLNLSIILFLSLTISLTVYRICDDYQALSFLKMSKYLPQTPWKIPVFSCLFFIVIGLLNRVEARFPKRQWLSLLFYLCNLLLCCAITYNLNFSYKGFFLFLIAYIFLNVQSMPLKAFSLCLTFVCFITFDYDFLTVSAKLVSFQDFIGYYTPQSQITLYGVKATLDSVNLILVIIFFYQLVQGKIRENREFIELNKQLETSLARLRLMTDQLEEAAKIKERNRLAHEIHDILGHSLTCIDTGLEACIELASDSSGELSGQLRKIKRFADEGLLDIRRSVQELKKDANTHRSLIDSLEHLVQGINGANIRNATLRTDGEPPDMEQDEEQTIFRMVQESITNSINHGHAKKIEIALVFRQTTVELETRDDGIGCDEISRNFGLAHMEEQVALLGGTIDFESAIGEGFRIYAILPIRRHIK